MFSRLNKLYHEFPLKFWVLVLAMFIDMIGGTLIHPFFALYITKKFGVGMTQAGMLIGIFSFSGLLGSMVGGALTDKFGRRRLVLFGLVFSALSMLSIGFTNDLGLMYPLAVFVGLLSSIAGPAHQAMVADMLPEEKRQEGFSIMRVVANLSWIIGPTIGGFVARSSYLMLFILDAIFSCITAVIVFRLIPETKPEAPPDKRQQSILETIGGYRIVLRDGAYIAFLLISMLMLIVYQQLYNTLSVFLRDVHGLPEQGYGFLLSMNAAMVVLLQFWVTRQTRRYPPFLMMALGTGFYLVGFTMFGFISAFSLFTVAMLIITVGEMIVVPIGQALAANFAPEDMRGRYMAFFGLSWAIPSTIGPWMAGMILDNFNPNWLWYAAGVICTIALLGFYALHLKLRSQKRFAPTTREEKVAIS